MLEINPVTLQLVWSSTNARFFSTNISGAQRLPNGNTLITAGAGGRMFEVTREGAIVWEYMFPMFSGANQSNAVYRAYRLPSSTRGFHICPPDSRAASRDPSAAWPDFRVP